MASSLMRGEVVESPADASEEESQRGAETAGRAECDDLLAPCGAIDVRLCDSSSIF